MKKVNIEVQDTVAGKTWICETLLMVRKKTRLSSEAIKNRLLGITSNTKPDGSFLRYTIRDLDAK